MMDIKISVVVPTYRRPLLLKNCLQNLCDQILDKEKYEVIIVSDGPDDESKKAVDEFIVSVPVNIRFLSLPAKKGPAAARNLGWQNANGVVIAFTDDDCLPDNNWLESICVNYKNEAEIAYTGKVIVPVSAKPTDFELNTKGLETGDFVTANCAVTRATLEAIGGFDEAFTSAWREDSDLEFKLLLRNISIIKLNDAVVVHPVRKAPWGISIQEQEKTMYNALLYKKYPALYRRRVKSGPSWNYYFIILSFAAFLVAAYCKITWLIIIGFICWLSLTMAFAFKRISATRKTAAHIFEMIVTSAIIPFLSILWTLYGAVKYRVLFF